MDKCCGAMWNGKLLPMDEVLKGCLNPYFNEMNNDNENNVEMTAAAKKSLNITNEDTKTAETTEIKCERCIPKNG